MKHNRIAPENLARYSRCGNCAKLVVFYPYCESEWDEVGTCPHRCGDVHGDDARCFEFFERIGVEHELED